MGRVCFSTRKPESGFPSVTYATGRIVNLPIQHSIGQIENLCLFIINFMFIMNNILEVIRFVQKNFLPPAENAILSTMKLGGLTIHTSKIPPLSHPNMEATCLSIFPLPSPPFSRSMPLHKQNGKMLSLNPKHCFQASLLLSTRLCYC